MLRNGIPIKNKEIREIQNAVESIKADLKTRRTAFAQSDFRSVKALLARNGASILKLVPEENKELAATTLDKLTEDLIPLGNAINIGASTGQGSLQERAKLDEAFDAQHVVSEELSILENCLVPKSYKRSIPAEYSALPRLQGRAEVVMVINKQGGGKFDIDGKLFDQAEMKLVVDG